MELVIKRYTPEYINQWNKFVAEAKNSHFFFNRDYMDYHADRFTDHSLLFFKENELMCVLPANESQGILSSHGGLTFGGFIISHRANAIFIIEAVDGLVGYMKSNNCKTLLYKCIPYIYYKLPSQEDLYALFLKGATLYRRDLGSVIDLKGHISYTKGTKSNLSKARKSRLVIQESKEYALFMRIEEEILSRKYNTKPVHSAWEIQLLAEKFPENIKLYLIYKDDLCLGGAIVYITDTVLHTQYIGITDEGKQLGALDFLTDTLINKYKDEKNYYSFGISTEKEGHYLNEGLIKNKESFGARAIVNDYYKIQID